jgi:hypothetical protein
MRRIWYRKWFEQGWWGRHEISQRSLTGIWHGKNRDFHRRWGDAPF